MPSKSVLARKQDAYRSRANEKLSVWYTELYLAYESGKISYDEFKRIKAEFLRTGRSVDYVITIGTTLDNDLIAAFTIEPSKPILIDDYKCTVEHIETSLGCEHVVKYAEPELHKTRTVLEISTSPPILECANGDVSEVRSTVRARQNSPDRITRTYHYDKYLSEKIKCWLNRYQALPKDTLRSSLVKSSFSSHRVLNVTSPYDYSPKFSIKPSGQKLQVSPDHCYNRFATFKNSMIRNPLVTIHGCKTSVISFDLGMCVNLHYGHIAIQCPEKFIVIVRNVLPPHFTQYPFRAVVRIKELITVRPGLLPRIHMDGKYLILYENDETDFLEVYGIHVVNVKWKPTLWFDGIDVRK